MIKKTNKSKVKVGKLKVDKETVKDLADKESRQIKGGATNTCNGGDGIVRATQVNCANVFATYNCNGGEG